MAVKADKLGAGKLTIGATTSLKNFESQCVKAEFKPELEVGDIRTVLSGETDRSDTKDSFTLSLELIQEYGTDNLAQWSYANKGQVLPFEYIPLTAGEMKVTGELQIVPIGVGGDAGKSNTISVEFKGTKWAYVAYTPPVS